MARKEVRGLGGVGQVPVSGHEGSERSKRGQRGYCRLPGRRWEVKEGSGRSL